MTDPRILERETERGRAVLLDSADVQSRAIWVPSNGTKGTVVSRRRARTGRASNSA